MLKSSFVFLALFLGITANANMLVIPNVDPMALLNWKVGDSADYNVTAIFGKLGTMHNEVTKEEGNGVWLSETMVTTGKSDKSEMLFDRDSAKVLKYIHNGKEETIPNDNPEIISQDYTQVTVPAGTFNAMHVVAKTKSISHMEIWQNNVDVAIDGTIKTIVTTQFGNITMELTKQNKTP